MRTLVYIDGFNFYYRNVKNTPNKWLDFKKFFELLLGPKHQILKIKYFTALVTGKVDPHQPVRQETFLRALQKHIPELSIYYGHFLSHDKYMPLSYPIDKRSLGEDIKFAQVIKTEEKGSDVNLAVHLLNDAWLNEYDCAVIASNDSDLVESFKFIKTLHSKRIGRILPRTGHPSKVLMRHADFKKKIRMNALAKCQLPDPIPGTSIRKPKVW